MPLDLRIKHEEDEPDEIILEPDEEESEQGLYYLSSDSDNTTLPWPESPTHRISLMNPFLLLTREILVLHQVMIL